MARRPSGPRNESIERSRKTSPQMGFEFWSAPLRLYNLAAIAVGTKNSPRTLVMRFEGIIGQPFKRQWVNVSTYHPTCRQSGLEWRVQVQLNTSLALTPRSVRRTNRPTTRSKPSQSNQPNSQCTKPNKPKSDPHQPKSTPEPGSSAPNNCVHPSNQITNHPSIK